LGVFPWMRQAANPTLNKKMHAELIEGNVVLKLSFDFSLMVMDYCEELQRSKKYVLAHQLLKSGTSIGANITEAQNAVSLADFIHKFKTAAKEGEETQYWLLLCDHAKDYPAATGLLSRLDTIQKLMTKIISSSRKKMQANR
jgi:four helix bundle protein